MNLSFFLSSSVNLNLLSFSCISVVLILCSWPKRQNSPVKNHVFSAPRYSCYIAFLFYLVYCLHEQGHV